MKKQAHPSLVQKSAACQQDQERTGGSMTDGGVADYPASKRIISCASTTVKGVMPHSMHRHHAAQQPLRSGKALPRDGLPGSSVSARAYGIAGRGHRVSVCPQRVGWRCSLRGQKRRCFTSPQFSAKIKDETHISCAGYTQRMSIEASSESAIRARLAEVSGRGILMRHALAK